MQHVKLLLWEWVGWAQSKVFYELFLCKLQYDIGVPCKSLPACLEECASLLADFLKVWIGALCVMSDQEAKSHK